MVDELPKYRFGQNAEDRDNARKPRLERRSDSPSPRYTWLRLYHTDLNRFHGTSTSCKGEWPFALTPGICIFFKLNWYHFGQNAEDKDKGREPTPDRRSGLP